MVEAINAEDGVVKDVAERLGCSRLTVYRYRDRYKTVEEALEKNRTDLVYEMRDRLKDMARDESVSDNVRFKAQIRMLEVFDDEVDWEERKRLDHGNAGDEPLTMQWVDPDSWDAED